MIGAIATLFLGSAALADFSRREHTRLLLGQWKQLFDERGLAGSMDLIDQLSHLEDDRVYRTAAGVFKDWFESLVIATANSREEAIVRAIDLLGNKIYHCIASASQKNELTGLDEYLDEKPIACRIVRVASQRLYGPSPVRLLVVLKPINPAIELTNTMKYGPWIEFFREET